MTPQEAIILVEECGLNIEGIVSAECEKVVLNALSKQIPKKVEKIKSGFKSFNYVCPECAYRQISQIEGEWIAGQHYNYCSNCGQALDWSDTNDR